MTSEPTDAELLDYLERAMREQLGGNTVERWIACSVHTMTPLRQAIAEARQCWPDGSIEAAP